MTRPPPHRAAVAAVLALAIAAVGLNRPGIARIAMPAIGKIDASFHPSFLNVHLTLEIRP